MNSTITGEGKCDITVTRKQSDFNALPVKAIAPEEFLDPVLE